MKLKIRFFITHYQPIYTGAGKSLEKLINGIDKNKFDIEIITTHKKGLKRNKGKNGYYIKRVGCSFFNKNGYLNPFGKLCFAFLSAFYNLIHNKYNIIIFIGVGAISLPSILVSKILNKKIINKTTAVGDDDPEKLSKSIIGRIIINLLNSEYHWVISEEIKQKCLKYTKWKKHNIFLITNPVKVKYLDYNKLIAIRKNFSVNKKITFLFVGVLDKRKGIDILLDIWSKNNINANLILCGPRGKDKEINNRLNNCKQYNIVELGEMEHSKIEKEYLKSTFFIFPSRREGLPNVLLEAMSFGVPIISNKMDGVTDFLLGSNNERGILIENNDYEKWVKIVKDITNDSHDLNFELISKNAYTWIKNNAELSVVVNKMEKLYYRLIIK